MFALDLVMIHKICLTCNETFYPVVHICEEMCKSVAVTQVSYAYGYYVWNKGSVPRFHIFWILFQISTRPVKLWSTTVNVGLPISLGLGIEISHSTMNWFGVIIWFTLWASMIFNVSQCTFGTFGTSFAIKKALSTTNHKITIFSPTTFVTRNVKIHCHAMVHPCAKF